MAQKRFSPETVAQCKRFFIYEGWGFEKISEFFEGSPHAKTLSNWADEKNDDEKNWHDLRQEYIDSIVDAVTPEEIQRLYMKRIYETLSDPQWNTKHSDALRKLQKDFSSITEPGRQIPVMYSMLTQLISFLKQYHDEIVTPEFLQAVTEFKNLKREIYLEGK